MERNANKFPMYAWGTLGALCLAGVLCGAWWHLGTAAICAVMFMTYKSEMKEER